MQNLNEDKLEEVVIDFEDLRSNKLNEDYWSSFGSRIKLVLDNMFGTNFISMNLKVRGTPREIKSFQNALGSEAKYIKTARDYGLDNPRTYKNKAKLDSAVKSFEKVTGLIWPFK
tara:strand:- start:842 stop:1186 length:345 start_codon:yes stop_codon:yes gene_type:complete